MAEAPVARSPIAPAAPVTVEHGWEISARRTGASLRIMDCTPLAKVLVHACADGEVARILAVPFGRMARDEHETLVVGSGPGEWLLLAPPGAAQAVIRRVEEMPDEGLVSVFDATHGRALMRITGARAADLLSKVCGVDLSEKVTPDGAAFRSSVAKLVTDVVRDDQDGVLSYLLHCERSSGQYLFDALIDAGDEFGIEVEGFVAPQCEEFPDDTPDRDSGTLSGILSGTLVRREPANGWRLSQRASLPQGDIAFDTFGEGPPVVLVHGTPTWSYVWRRVVPGLSDRFTVYVFDLLGYGDSEPAGQDVSIAAQTRLLTELIGLWGLGEPAVAGHDIGGAIVLRTQLLNEVPFSRIALIDAVVLRPWITPTSRHMQAHLDAYRTMPTHIYERVAAAHIATAVHRPMDEAAFEQYFSRWRGKEGQEAYLQKVAQFDERYTAEFEHLLGSLRVPIRIIWGERDAWLDPAFARRLHELVPNSDLKVIPGAGHFAMEDAPEEVTRELRDFFMVGDRPG